MAAAAAAASASHAINASLILAPAIVAAFPAYWYKDAIADRCNNILGAHKHHVSKTSNFVCVSGFPALTGLSISTTSHESHQQLHAFSSEDKVSSYSTATSSLFGERDCLSYEISRLRKQRRFRKPSRAYRNDFFYSAFRYPVLNEKPEWWWRTLAFITYLFALQISDTGYFIQPFLEHHDFLGDLIFYIPGAITRLPAWFSMAYCHIAYVGIVKNKDWPHFFRFHLMMGMLLETALQLTWYISNQISYVTQDRRLPTAFLGIVWLLFKSDDFFFFGCWSTSTEQSEPSIKFWTLRKPNSLKDKILGLYGQCKVFVFDSMFLSAFHTPAT